MRVCVHFYNACISRQMISEISGRLQFPSLYYSHSLKSWRIILVMYLQMYQTAVVKDELL